MKPRLIAIGLIASAALNLFLICAGAAVVARGVRLAGQPRAAAAAAANPARPALRRAAAALAPADRARFVYLLRAEGKTVQPDNRRARGLRLQAWGSLAAPSFDAAAAKDELARARAINQRSRGEVEDAVIDFAAALPADERARLGGAMRGAVVGVAGSRGAGGATAARKQLSAPSP